MAMGKMFKAKRRVGRPRKIVPRVSSNVKAYVKQAISKKVETFTEGPAAAPADIQASTTETVVVLTNPSIGGNAVRCESVEIKGRINSTSTNTDSVRIMLVRSKTDTAPSFADLFDNPSTYAILSMNRKPEFQVLVDKRYNIDIVQRKQHFFNIRKSIKKPIKNETTGTDSESGHIYLMVLGSLTAASTNGAVIKYDKLCKYKDF